MTVTTNAMLEGTFARTAFFATQGFVDIEQLGRQNRADLYRLCAPGPVPIVPADLRYGVRERCGPEGVVSELDESSVERACANCAGAEVESIAVCLLFSFRYPKHEQRVREIIARELPHVHVSLSHEVVGTFREYERAATTIADAALSPLLADYLGVLAERAAQIGLPQPEVMLSNGGAAGAKLAAQNAASTVLSGPAGGAIGAALAASRRGVLRAIGFDMGGTSTDVCVVDDGEVRTTGNHEIGGRPIALPTLDIGTVGAGGGSIAWRDDGGALRVGPHSAGADPGPACYGHGGQQPTVTDANLLLGYLDSNSALAGGLQLDHDAAVRAIGSLADSLMLDVHETAAGIIEIANLEMQGQVAAMTVARGVDPREHSLVAFGGAGPMHGAAIADALGIGRVICPAACGVLSAVGMAAAGSRRDHSLSIVRSLGELDRAQVERVIEQLAARGAEELQRPLHTLQTRVVHSVRYRGQGFELAVESEFEQLERAFHDAHRERFGFSDPTGEVELVTVRVSVEAVGAPPSTMSVAPSSTIASRSAWFNGRWRSTQVRRGAQLL
ncbi:MAG: hydantoinase/oxoprolinase family protein, partial [Solirubrobacterales bacterium]